MGVNVLEMRRRDIIAGQPHLETASGALVTLSKAASAKVQNCQVAINLTQTGSGNPSPSNVRPITGWTVANISRSGVDTSDPTVYNIQFPSSAGTVYGGTLDVTTGELVVTHHGIWAADIANLGYDGKDSTKYTIYIKFSTNNLIGVEGKARSGVSNRFTQSMGGPGNMDMVYWSTTHIYMSLPINELEEESLAGAHNWFVANPTLIVYELRSPITYQLTPQEIKTLAGTNNIWADTGNIALTYWKH